MDNRLLDILVCPICKGPLEHRKADRELVCPRDRVQDVKKVVDELKAKGRGDLT